MSTPVLPLEWGPLATLAAQEAAQRAHRTDPRACRPWGHCPGRPGPAGHSCAGLFATLCRCAYCGALAPDAERPHCPIHGPWRRDPGEPLTCPLCAWDTRPVLRIILTPDGWAADYSATPEAARVRALFGSAIIPTPYPATVPAARVLAALAPLNPAYVVRVAAG